MNYFEEDNEDVVDVQEDDLDNPGVMYSEGGVSIHEESEVLQEEEGGCDEHNLYNVLSPVVFII